MNTTKKLLSMSIGILLPALFLALVWLTVTGQIRPDALLEEYKQFGYVIVFAATLIEACLLVGFAFPGGFIVLAAASLTQPQGPFSMTAIITLGTSAALLGYLIDFFLGRLYSYELQPIQDTVKGNSRKSQTMTQFLERLYKDYSNISLSWRLFLGCAYPSVAAIVVFEHARSNKSPLVLLMALPFQLFWVTLWTVLSHTVGVQALRSTMNATTVLLCTLVVIYLLVQLAQAFNKR